ncbi:Acg family FMN-binding oxidoreductase [Aquimarina algiphila]|uniref:Acg family FMN-binding oxidoreductase n=1 Tax=Aquimarina algiphila TaxID=2047982 RepID=UPI00249144FD|nr:hypothetical protein [Aquimarina algiphila]
MNSDQTYNHLVLDTWRHSRDKIDNRQDIMRELVRYATLAANSHNTQPWRFKITSDCITILPDFTRECPVVDPNNHHLFASLGCATENMLLAAEAYGLKGHVSIDMKKSNSIFINFEPYPVSKSILFQAIINRQCTRTLYNNKPVPIEQLKTLENISQSNNVSIFLSTDQKDLKNILEYVIEANTFQMKDKAFVKELKEWLRFNTSSAISHRDGLFSAATGNPTLPTWIGNAFFTYGYNIKKENNKYIDHIKSSSGVIAFSSQNNTKENWINTGRSYQRFALQATVFGLKHAFINQPVEVPKIQTQLGSYLNIEKGQISLLVRFGYGPKLPRSLRRSIDHVII